jgi:hypothetical protein
LKRLQIKQRAQYEEFMKQFQIEKERELMVQEIPAKIEEKPVENVQQEEAVAKPITM